MKKIIILAAILTACKKEEVKPQQQVVAQTNTPIYCIYQNVFGTKSFLYCAKDINEFNNKYNQYQQANLNPSYDIKNNCNECK